MKNKLNKYFLKRKINKQSVFYICECVTNFCTGVTLHDTILIGEISRDFLHLFFFICFFHFICRVVWVLGFHEHRTIFHYDIKSDDHVYLVPAVDIGWFKSCDILITKCPDRKTPFRKSDVYLRCYFSLFFGYSMKKICKWCFRLYWPFVSIDEFLWYSYAIIFD